MCGSNTTVRKHSPIAKALTGAAAVALSAGFSAPAAAQMQGVLEEIVVTAQKREEALQDVPISVAQWPRRAALLPAWTRQHRL